ncbi:MAG: thioesterase family protein [Anaerolineae bacterium]
MSIGDIGYSGLFSLSWRQLGIKVRVRAELIEVDGRRLVFRVEAHDEVERVGEGEHHRMIIEKKPF